MSFKKIQKIDPWGILATGLPPDAGNVYLGQDNVGLWEMDEWGNIWYINSGVTNIFFMTGSTSSGTSGVVGTSGTSGVDGGTGTSGTAGKSGKDGTSGSSGIGSSGTGGVSGTSGTSSTAGTSGKTGSSGTSAEGSSGTAGSSGTDGEGSSGTSGSSGIDGAYGGATRLWSFSTLNPPSSKQFNAYSNTYLSYDLSLIEYIRINQEDFDGQSLNSWLDVWDKGVLKIEEWGNASNYGIYLVYSGTTKPFIDAYELTGYTIASAHGVLTVGKNYLISFVSNGKSGTSGKDGIGSTSGTSGVGTSGTSGKDGAGSSGTSGSGSSGTSGKGSSGTSGANGTAGFPLIGSCYQLLWRDTGTTSGYNTTQWLGWDKMNYRMGVGWDIQWRSDAVLHVEGYGELTSTESDIVTLKLGYDGSAYHLDFGLLTVPNWPYTYPWGIQSSYGPLMLNPYGNQVHIGPTGSTQNSGGTFLVSDEFGNVLFEITGSTVYVNGVMFPYQSSSAPTYQKGAVYFDTSLNKLRVGGVSSWETITSSP